MLELKYKNNWYALEFHGIKIIETYNSTKFIKETFFNEEFVLIENKKIKAKNIIYINELTKYEDLLSLNKTSFLYKMIVEKINKEDIINHNLLKKIIKEINNTFGFDELLIDQYDINKLILSLFKINDIGYINDNKICNLLNLFDFEEKMTIIFDDVSYLKYNDYIKLLNNFNVFIICNDIRKVIDNVSLLEICSIINGNEIVDIQNIEKLKSYLELKSSLYIDYKDMDNYLKKDKSQKSSIINFYIKNF